MLKEMARRPKGGPETRHLLHIFQRPAFKTTCVLLKGEERS